MEVFFYWEFFIGGGYKCLSINNLYNFRGGFGFKTAASSCPDGIACSGVAASSPSEFSSNFNKPIIFSKTMKEIKKFNKQERQAYVPASVKVITTSVQRVICASGDGTQQYSPEDGNTWF